MKYKTKLLPTPLSLKIALLGVLSFLAADAAKAATSLYLDVNGATTGNGTPTGTYSWESAIWNTGSAAAAAPITWGQGDFARFYAPGQWTAEIDLSQSETNAGMYIPNSGITNTIGGTGPLVIAAGDQGFLVCGSGSFGASAFVFTVPISGVDSTTAIAPENGGNTAGTPGSMRFYAANTFHGGIAYGYSSVGIPWLYYNNSSSFGDGPIRIASGSGFAPAANLLLPILAGGGSSYSLPNAFNLSAYAGANAFGYNFGGGAGAFTGLTLTGNWTTPATAQLLIRSSDGPLTLSGIISGAAPIGFSANSGGSITLSGANTYSGKTTIAAGANGSGTKVTVSSINSVTGGAANSSLGAPTTVANGTIQLGATTFQSAKTVTLVYTGPGETSDRVLNFGDSGGTIVLENDGSGALVFSSAPTAAAGNKALTLQGSNTGNNSIGSLPVQVTTINKSQAGKWIVHGTTSAASVAVNGGTLSVDSTTAFTSTTAVTISTGATLDLNYSGTLIVNSLTINGTQVPAGSTWGSPTSGAANTSASLTGTGFILAGGAPIITQQPVSLLNIWPDTASVNFTVAAVGDQGSMTFQWKRNGSDIHSDGISILGAESSSLTLFPPYTPGNYTVHVHNNFGDADSQIAVLSLVQTNTYVNDVRSALPVAYYRLDETSGSTAYEFISGHNLTYTTNVALNVAGVVPVPGTDPAAQFAIAVPPDNTQAHKGLAFGLYSNTIPGVEVTPFTVEAWFKSTDFSQGKQKIISSASLGNFGWSVGFGNATTLTFSEHGTGGGDCNVTVPQLAVNVWYYLVCVYNGNGFDFYLNGQYAGSAAQLTTPKPPSDNVLGIGANPGNYPREQFFGSLDEIAVYNYPLDGGTIAQHYADMFADYPPTTSVPQVSPTNNYVTQTTTLTEQAAGVGLHYQWYKGSGTGTPVGSDSSTLTLANIQLTDAGDYHVVITDINTQTADSALAHVSVTPIPGSADDLHLTNGLVLHLPFDSDYKDISGRANDGTAVGSPALTDGTIGAHALHFGTTNAPGNYVTLGVRPTLKFGPSNSFTVSYWYRTPDFNAAITNLPVFCDSANGPGSLGFYFGPRANDWESAFTTTNVAHTPSIEGGNLNIFDNTWHNVLTTVNRNGNMSLYVDGVLANFTAVSYANGETMDSALPANVGQTGAANLTPTAPGGGADVDDLLVWNKELSTFDITGIYLAGSVNHVSAAPVVPNQVPPTPVSLSITNGPGGASFLTWDNTAGWSLQASPTVSGGYTNVPSAGPGYQIPAAGSQLFYRLHILFNP